MDDSASSPRDERLHCLMSSWKALADHGVNPGNMDTLSQIITILGEMEGLVGMDEFVETLDGKLIKELMKNPATFFCLAEMHLYFNKFSLVFDMIKEVASLLKDCRKKLISLWDKTLYKEAEVTSKKTVNSLHRFRLRTRRPPPPPLCPAGGRPTAALPLEATRLLWRWCIVNSSSLYPCRRQKAGLAAQTGLSTSQIVTWFGNLRRQIKRVGLLTILKKKKEKFKIAEGIQVSPNGEVSNQLLVHDVIDSRNKNKAPKKTCAQKRCEPSGVPSGTQPVLGCQERQPGPETCPGQPSATVGTPPHPTTPNAPTTPHPSWASNHEWDNGNSGIPVNRAAEAGDQALPPDLNDSQDKAPRKTPVKKPHDQSEAPSDTWPALGCRVKRPVPHLGLSAMASTPCCPATPDALSTPATPFTPLLSGAFYRTPDYGHGGWWTNDLGPQVEPGAGQGCARTSPSDQMGAPPAGDYHVTADTSVGVPRPAPGEMGVPDTNSGSWWMDCADVWQEHSELGGWGGNQPSYPPRTTSCWTSSSTPNPRDTRQEQPHFVQQQQLQLFPDLHAPGPFLTDYPPTPPLDFPAPYSEHLPFAPTYPPRPDTTANHLLQPAARYPHHLQQPHYPHHLQQPHYPHHLQHPHYPHHLQQPHYPHHLQQPYYPHHLQQPHYPHHLQQPHYPHHLQQPHYPHHPLSPPVPQYPQYYNLSQYINLAHYPPCPDHAQFFPPAPRCTTLPTSHSPTSTTSTSTSTSEEMTFEQGVSSHGYRDDTWRMCGHTARSSARPSTNARVNLHLNNAQRGAGDQCTTPAPAVRLLPKQELAGAQLHGSGLSVGWSRCPETDGVAQPAQVLFSDNRWEVKPLQQLNVSERGGILHLSPRPAPSEGATVTTLGSRTNDQTHRGDEAEPADLGDCPRAAPSPNPPYHLYQASALDLSAGVTRSRSPGIDSSTQNEACAPERVELRQSGPSEPRTSQGDSPGATSEAPPCDVVHVLLSLNHVAP